MTLLSFGRWYWLAEIGLRGAESGTGVLAKSRVKTAGRAGVLSLGLMASVRRDSTWQRKLGLLGCSAQPLST